MFRNSHFSSIYFLKLSKCSISGWYYCHIHIQQYLQFPGKFKIYICLFTFFQLSVACRNGVIYHVYILHTTYYIYYLAYHHTKSLTIRDQCQTQLTLVFNKLTYSYHCHLFSWHVRFGLTLPHLHNGPFRLDWKR